MERATEEAKELFDEGLLDEDEFKGLKRLESSQQRAKRTTVPPVASDTFARSQTSFWKGSLIALKILSWEDKLRQPSVKYLDIIEFG